LKFASAPPHSSGHRFQLAKGTSLRELTCRYTHKAEHFIYLAVQLLSCLSPAAAVSPQPPPFFHAEFFSAGASGVTTVETCVGAAA
jgi:hypothetical protein